MGELPAPRPRAAVRTGRSTTTGFWARAGAPQVSDVSKTVNRALGRSVPARARRDVPSL